MCAGAIVLARLARVVFGAWDDKTGMVTSVGDLLRHPRLNHHPEVLGGILHEECGVPLREFFHSVEIAFCSMAMRLCTPEQSFFVA